ncbi:Protein kinase superfamily protein [Rhynchospora pubera]|uniref:Protein kinase superfamily protein n=1 Tax=Rhynchospora pubera TaxID=906938 RepID=A0AAV8G9E7_9POAL|nr:Protein kinase superfamily protein [Rhynchospora pubera]
MIISLFHSHHACATSRFCRKLSSFGHGESASPFGVGPSKIRIRLKRRNPSLRSSTAALTVMALMTDPNYFQVGRLVGSYGFVNITSYSSFQTEGMSTYDRIQEVDKLRVQNVGEGQVKIRIYEGRVIQGRLQGTNVLFKVYPGRITGGTESDLMAANELGSHASLQEDPRNICENIQFLLGAFETITGEQWLAFRNDGKFSAADYAKFASENISKGLSNSSPIFGLGQNWKARRYFVIKLLNGAMNGLAYMHENDRLHQSLGPSSVVMNTVIERDEAVLVPRLRDLAFSVDIRYSAIGDGPLSQDLWHRATSAGAFAPFEKRAFAIADDIYEAGFLFAYLAFVPFCEAGIIDGISLQRLLESTFRLDLSSVREYCIADDRLAEAVKFLDLGNGAGWELLQAMLNPDYKQRPIAQAVLNHRFMTGAVL